MLLNLIDDSGLLAAESMRHIRWWSNQSRLDCLPGTIRMHPVDRVGNETGPLFSIEDMRRLRVVVDYEDNQVRFKDNPGVWHELPTTKKGLVMIPLTKKAAVAMASVGVVVVVVGGGGVVVVVGVCGVGVVVVGVVVVVVAVVAVVAAVAAVAAVAVAVVGVGVVVVVVGVVVVGGGAVGGGGVMRVGVVLVLP